MRLNEMVPFEAPVPVVVYGILKVAETCAPEEGVYTAVNSVDCPGVRPVAPPEPTPKADDPKSCAGLIVALPVPVYVTNSVTCWDWPTPAATTLMLAPFATGPVVDPL